MGEPQELTSTLGSPTDPSKRMQTEHANLPSAFLALLHRKGSALHVGLPLLKFCAYGLHRLACGKLVMGFILETGPVSTPLQVRN